MRYFLVKNSLAVVEKQAMEGDNTKIDAQVNQFKVLHPTWTVTETDQAGFDSTPMDSASVLASDRASAISSFLSDTSGNAKVLRAVMLVLLDEVNVIRALLSGPPAARTATQFRTAVQNKINSGAAD